MRRRIHYLISATAMLIVTSGTASWACPKGPRESELSISSVMRNFGRFLTPADSLSTRGRQDPKAVSEKEFAPAIDGIGQARSCAEAVLHDTAGSLWPTKAYRLPPADRDAYLKIFYSHMQAFEEKLADYQAELSRLQTASNQERDFAKAALLKDAVRNSARKAHEDTQ